jgi:hypothetical protein
VAEIVGIGASNIRLCRRRDVGIESGDETRDEGSRGGKLKLREAGLLQRYCGGSADWQTHGML